MALEMEDCCPLPAAAAAAAAPLIPLRLKLSLRGEKNERSSNTRPNADWNSRLIDQNAPLSLSIPPSHLLVRSDRKSVAAGSSSSPFPSRSPETDLRPALLAPPAERIASIRLLWPPPPPPPPPLLAGEGAAVGFLGTVIGRGESSSSSKASPRLAVRGSENS